LCHLCHYSPVLSQKSGFWATWSDCSETLPENQKKFKDHDSLRRNFLRDSAPQNPKFHRLDPFFKIFHINRKIRKNLHWFYLIFRIFWCYFYDFIWHVFSIFYLVFFVVFKSKTQNCWLYIRIVRIIKSEIVNMNPECTRTFLKILQGAREDHRVGKVIPYQ